MMRCKLKSGKMGYKYGKSGKCYARKSSANKQKRAMYASGYKGKK